MPDPTDSELISACQEGRANARQAFDALYARHAGAIHAFLRGLNPGDEHAARDALQETFMRCYKALPSFDTARPLRPWLFRIARNVTLDANKRASAQRETPAGPDAIGALAGQDGSPGPLEQAATQESYALLRAALNELHHQDRAVFLLRHDQGLTYAEVAEALGCSLRTAKYRMRNALEHLGRVAEEKGVVS